MKIRHVERIEEEGAAEDREYGAPMKLTADFTRPFK